MSEHGEVETRGGEEDADEDRAQLHGSLDQAIAGVRFLWDGG